MKLNRKHLTTILATLLLAILTHSATAYDFMVDGIAYNIHGNEVGVAYKDISDENDYDDYGSYEGDIIIPESVTYNGITYSVTSIDGGAFAGCWKLMGVTIPNSVNEIGGSAFYGCHNLTSIIIPDSVISIGDETFWLCSGLRSITIGSSVTSIGSDAFFECLGLDDVTIKSNSLVSKNHSLCSIFGGYVRAFIIGDNVTTIGEGAFESGLFLESVFIPNSVTSIGCAAFRNCDQLESVTIPSSVTEIGRLAFSNCSSLKTLYYNAINCQSLGQNCFENVSLNKFIISDEVEHIPAGLPIPNMSEAFLLPNNLKSIAAGAITNNATSLVLSDSIETIGPGAVTNISTVFVSRKVPTDISVGAFSNPQTLYVPVGCISKYIIATGWDEFFNIQEGEYVHANVTLDRDTARITKGNTLQLTATITPEEVANKPIRWLSTNTNVATVSSSGLVTALQIGETDIYAYIGDSFAICHIIVANHEVTGITLSQNEVQIAIDDYVDITATVVPNNAHDPNVTWQVPDNDVIYSKAFDGNRLRVLGLKNGKVTVTAVSTDNSNVTASCVVKVGTASDGDVNGDGRVNVSDVSALINMILGLQPMDQALGDVNGDGRVNVSDVSALINIILGIQ